jgi:hypothetical protein
VEAISRAPIEFPLVTAAERDGDLADGAAVACRGDVAWKVGSGGSRTARERV